MVGRYSVHSSERQNHDRLDPDNFWFCEYAIEKTYLFLLFLPRRIQQPFPFPFLFRFHVPVAVVDVVRMTVHGDHRNTALLLLLLLHRLQTNGNRYFFFRNYIILTVLSDNTVVHHRRGEKNVPKYFEKKTKTKQND